MKSDGVWAQVFDEIKLKEGLTSDAALAESLGVSRAFVCAVRKNRKGVSNELGQALYKRLGRPVSQDDLQLFMSPRVQKAASRRVDMETRKLVLMRANGICELCLCPAPFVTQNGEPYLEIHSLFSVFTDETMTPNNVVALCPNCHRKLELCPTADDLLKLVTGAKINIKKSQIGLIIDSHKHAGNRDVGLAGHNKAAKSGDEKSRM